MEDISFAHCNASPLDNRTSHPQIGGLQVYVDRLTNSLAKLSEVGLVTGLKHRAPANPSIAHFKVANLTRSGAPAAWQQAALDVSHLVAEYRPDVVHFASATVAVYRAAIPAEVAVVATVHGNDLTWPWVHPGEDSTAWIL